MERADTPTPTPDEGKGAKAVVIQPVDVDSEIPVAGDGFVGAMESIAREVSSVLGAPKCNVKSLIPQTAKFDPPKIEEGDEEEDWEWTDVSNEPRKVFGGDALAIHPSEPYEVVFPLRYGRLDLSNGRSKEGLLTLIEEMWRRAITDDLDLPLEDVARCGAMLVVPWLHSRHETKAMVSILFKIGFERVFVHQDAVCTCLGLGLSMGCVVDIGHTKTTVVCVEECSIVPSTRIAVPSGGAQETELLNFLTARMDQSQRRARDVQSGAGLDLSVPSNEHYLNQLKEDQCRFFLKITSAADVVATATEQIEDMAADVSFYLPPYIPIESKPKFHYTIAGTSFYISPMSLFRFRDVGCSKWFGNCPDFSWAESDRRDAEDPLVEFFEARPIKNDESALISKRATDLAECMQLLPDLNEYMSDPPDTLEDAIKQSISNVPDLSTQAKLFESIILSGGGGSIPNAQSALETLLSKSLEGQSQRVAVVSARNDLKFDSLAWRGAAVVAVLDGAKEWWVGRDEWARLGVRAIRERVPFVW